VTGPNEFHETKSSRQGRGANTEVIQPAKSSTNYKNLPQDRIAIAPANLSAPSPFALRPSPFAPSPFALCVSPCLPCPCGPCPALPLPCPAPAPALPCPALPLPCPALPCPALPCPALPLLPCPGLPPVPFALVRSVRCSFRSLVRSVPSFTVLRSWFRSVVLRSPFRRPVLSSSFYVLRSSTPDKPRPAKIRAGCRGTSSCATCAPSDCCRSRVLPSAA
jgi:hypothetical protein